MIYAIDIDTRMVESKHKTKILLEKYVSDNGIEEAVYLISSEDELAFEFTLEQMQSIYNNLPITGQTRIFMNEDEAAEFCWDALEDNQKSFPTFTQKLGAKLLSAAAKRDGISGGTGKSGKASTPAKTKTPQQSTDKATRLTRKTAQTVIFVCGVVIPKAGTQRAVNYAFIEENLGEATYQELVDNFTLETGKDDAAAISYILGNVRKEILAVKSDEDDL